MSDRANLIDRLAPMCRNELDRNAWKGDEWNTLEPHQLGWEVLYHAAKLHRALTAGDREAIAELTADVANCAAIAADRVDALSIDHLPATDGPVTERPADGEYDGGRRYGGQDVKDIVTVWCGELDSLPTPDGAAPEAPAPDPAASTDTEVPF